MSAQMQERVTRWGPGAFVALAVVLTGIIVIMVAFIGMNAVKGTLPALDPAVEGVAETLDEAARGITDLEAELEHLNPVFNNVETLILRDVSGILEDTANGFSTAETGLVDTLPMLENIETLFMQDALDVIAISIETVDASEATVREIRSAARGVSRMATNSETELDRIVQGITELRDEIARARVELDRMEFQPLIVSARDLRQFANEVDEFGASTGIPIDVQFVRDHADFLEQEGTAYIFDPGRVYPVTAHDLRRLAGEVDAAAARFDFPFIAAPDTEVLYRHADHMERQNLLYRFGVHPFLEDLEREIGKGTSIAEPEIRRGIQETVEALDRTENEVNRILVQIGTIQRVLTNVESNTLPTFTNGVRDMQHMVGNGRQDLANVRGRIQEAQTQVHEIANAVQIGRDVTETGRTELTTLSSNLTANAADIRTIQIDQTISQIISLVQWVIVILGLGMIGGGSAFLFVRWRQLEEYRHDRFSYSS